MIEGELKKYDGGKNGSGTYQQIINVMPPHKIYIEGFLGSGAIMRRKRAAATNIGYDMDPKVIGSFKDASRYIIKRMDTIEFLKTSVDLINLLHDAGIKILIYLDPPYPKFTRLDQNDLYKYEMTDEQHEMMLLAITQLKCDVLVSSYKNTMYDRVLKNWNHHEFQSQTRIGPRIECLYYNYEKPTELHDYRYLGEDFRERDAIKGRINRRVSKIISMPAAEQNSLLQQLEKLRCGTTE